MFYWQCNAIVKDGEVLNVVVGEVTDCMTSGIAIYGEGTIAVSVSNPDIPVQIGDTYDGTNFYREGTKVEPIPNESALLKIANSKANNALANTGVNGESIVDIENAILELYELIGG